MLPVMGIEELEAAAAQGWRALEEERLGDWRLRAAEGFTGRANSALAIGDPGRSLAAATEAVGRWYQARDLPAMIAVPYPLGRPDRSPLDRVLLERGWKVRARPVTVMTGDAAGIARPARPAPWTVGLDSEPSDAWLAMYHYLGQETPPVARKLLTSAPWQAFAVLREGRELLAIGRVAGAGEWAGLTAIEVHPGHRRRGLASAVTAALAGVAAGRGANGLYLQVEDHNTAARALYRRAGFADHHGYHYRVAPD
jgi:ribosomal protein S18 acetylase RimI-like enzyme